ncbi:helix-turn-helix domain-containing protein [Microlunatus parietis]|uniref:Transcriptional regulator with XRE-family HTH domain n=1 Tax=Microlunatus parietis TaxID=682979 RepID=A0A7Y9L6K8_9ACTN|nr:helix-turn-helix transcriptional regulator [Microlunatus parietis]NYE68894.1 transcriptional regulator with XRE-family HTH domain [Microlunatus parietis]
MSEAKVSELRPTYGADTLQDRVTGVVFTLLAIRRMSQNQLAAALEIAPSTLSGKLGGRRRWSIDDLAELASIFGVNPQIFLRQPGEIFAAALELDGNGVTRE